MSDKRESLLVLRTGNVRLEHGIASKPARRAIRRIRAGLTRRGLTTAQREEALRDTLLIMGDAEAAGEDPMKMLLGDGTAIAHETGIEAYCDNVAEECPRLPMALAIIRFFALMAVALSIVLALHLAYRIVIDQPFGWLPFYDIDLRFADAVMLRQEILLVPVLFLVLQILSSLIPRNSWPRALPVVTAPALFLVVMMIVTDAPVLIPGGFALYNPLASGSIDALQRLIGESLAPFGTGMLLFSSEEGLWVIANRFVLMGGIAALGGIGLGITYFIESYGAQRRYMTPLC